MRSIIQGLTLLIALALCYANFAGEPSLSVKPQPLVKGQRAQIEIVSDEDVPEIVEFPELEGIRWLGKIAQFSQEGSVNFKSTTRHTVVYAISVEKEGQIKFPSLKLKIGRRKIALDPFGVEAVAPRITSGSGGGDGGETLDNYLHVKAFPLSERTEFYVGEDIPFEVAVFCASGIGAEYSYPEFEVPDIVFRDFSAVNEKNAKFAGHGTATEDVAGKTFNTIRFKTVFKATRPGSLDGEIKVETRIRVPRSRDRRRRPSGFSDPLFEGFFGDPFSNYDTVAHTLSCKMPSLKIAPLPSKPQDSVFTGLVGDWKLGFEIPDSGFKVGESFTLKINAEGRGGMDNLRPPEINVEGFRAYKPETRRQSSPNDLKENGTIEYVMVPLKEGDLPLDLSFSTFSTKKGEYESWRLSRRISAAKPDEGASSALISSADPGKKPSHAAERPKEELSDILYLKKGSHGALSVPLWRNRLWLLLAVALCGPLLLLASETIHILSTRRMDPATLRRSAAERKRRDLLRRIASISDESCDSFVRDELCPWVNDMKGHPPGTSAEEMMGKLEDRELAALIGDSSRGAYLPGGSGMKIEEKRRILSQALRRISVLLIWAAAFAPGLVSDAQDKVLADKTSASPSRDPFALFDKGDFEAAAAIFSERLVESPEDPYLLYDVGCCLYRMGRLSEALYFFEKANMLAPRDSDIRENMNHTRRKLDIGEKGTADSPAEMAARFRDMLRPDEWLLFAAASSLLLFAALSRRRRMSSEQLWALSAIIVLGFSAALMAFVSQISGDYGGDEAMIVRRAAQVHVLPSESSPKTEIRPREGQRVKLVEERSEWSRIRLGEGEGWVERGAVRRFW